MTPNANVAAWRTSTEPSWRGIALKALAVSVIALLAAQYLAGYLFLWWFRADPKQATPLTVARYAYYYGDREQVRAGEGRVLVPLAEETDVRADRIAEG